MEDFAAKAGQAGLDADASYWIFACRACCEISALDRRWDGVRDLRSLDVPDPGEQLQRMTGR